MVQFILLNSVVIQESRFNYDLVHLAYISHEIIDVTRNNLSLDNCPTTYRTRDIDFDTNC